MRDARSERLTIESAVQKEDRERGGDGVQKFANVVACNL